MKPQLQRIIAGVLNYRCCPNPKLFGIIASQMHKLNLGQSIQNFVHPKLFMASQIIYGIPNYLWHPKLFMASRITYGIPNYLWHPKLFDIPNYYDIPNLGFPLTFENFPIIYQIISKGVNMCNI